MKRLLSAALAGLLLCALAGCGLLSPAPQRREVAYLDLFDTVTTLVAYTDDEDEFTRTAELAHELLLEYHRLYDIYNDYEGLNNLKTAPAWPQWRWMKKSSPCCSRPKSTTTSPAAG